MGAPTRTDWLLEILLTTQAPTKGSSPASSISAQQPSQPLRHRSPPLRARGHFEAQGKHYSERRSLAPAIVNDI